MPHVDEHHDEEEEHHDPAGVDEYLHGSDELRRFHDKEHSNTEKRQQQKERGMHRIAHSDYEN